MDGYFSIGKCWPSPYEAIDAYYSNATVQPLLSGTTTVTSLSYQFGGDPGNWWITKKSISSTGVVTTNWEVPAPTNVYSTCTIPDNTFDPVADSSAFYAIAFVFLASIWALKKLVSLFDKDS